VKIVILLLQQFNIWWLAKNLKVINVGNEFVMTNFKFSFMYFLRNKPIKSIEEIWFLLFVTLLRVALISKISVP